MAESVLFTGFVGKQLGDGSWKKRLLKITTQAIQFFKTTQNNETLDENYNGNTIVSVASADSITNKPNTFVVELNTGEGIYCGAENAKAVDSWIKQVQQLIDRSNNGDETQDQSEVFSPVPVSSTSVAAPAVAPATMPNVMFPAAIVILISQYSKTFLELLYPLFETQTETVKSPKLFEAISTQIKSNMEKLNLPTHQQQVLLAYLNGNETKEIVQTIVQNRQPTTVLSFLLMDFVEFVQNSVHLPLAFFNQKLATTSTTSPTASTSTPTVPSSKPVVPSAKPKAPPATEESTPPVPSSKPPRRASSIDDGNNNNTASSPVVPTKPAKQVSVVEPVDSPSTEMTGPPIPKSKPPLPPSVLAQKDPLPVDDENAPPVYLDFDSLEKRDKLESFSKTRASVRMKKKSSRNSEGLKDQLSNMEEQAKAESLNEVGSLPAPATPSKRPDPPPQKPSFQASPEQPVVAVQPPQQSEEPEPQSQPEQPPQQVEEQTPPPLTRKPTGGIAGGVALFPMGALPPGGVAALRKSVQIDPNRKPIIPPENEETSGKNSPAASAPPLKKASIIKANQQTEEAVTVPDLPNKPAPPPPKKPGFFNSPENPDDFVRPTPPSARKPTIPTDEPTNSPPVPSTTKKPQFVQNSEENSSPVPPPSARKPPVPSAKPPTVPSTAPISDHDSEESTPTPTSEKSTPTSTAVQGGFKLPEMGAGKPLKKAPPVPPEYESQAVTAPVIPKKPAPAATSETADAEVKQVDFRHMLKKKDADTTSQPASTPTPAPAPAPAPAVPQKVEEPVAAPPKPAKKAPPVPQPQAQPPSEDASEEAGVKQLDFRGLLKKKEGEEKTATPPPKESSPAPATTPPPKPSKPAPAVPPTAAPAPVPTPAPVKDEPKSTAEEIKQVDFRNQLKKKPAEGVPETSNKPAASDEVKQLDFRNLLKKRPE